MSLRLKPYSIGDVTLGKHQKKGNKNEETDESI